MTDNRAGQKVDISAHEVTQIVNKMVNLGYMDKGDEINQFARLSITDDDLDACKSLYECGYPLLSRRVVSHYKDSKRSFAPLNRAVDKLSLSIFRWQWQNGAYDDCCLLDLSKDISDSVKMFLWSSRAREISTSDALSIIGNAKEMLKLVGSKGVRYDQRISGSTSSLLDITSVPSLGKTIVEFFEGDINYVCSSEETPLERAIIDCGFIPSPAWGGDDFVKRAAEEGLRDTLSAIVIAGGGIANDTLDRCLERDLVKEHLHGTPWEDVYNSARATRLLNEKAGKLNSSSQSFTPKAISL